MSQGLNDRLCDQCHRLLDRHPVAKRWGSIKQDHVSPSQPAGRANDRYVGASIRRPSGLPRASASTTRSEGPKYSKTSSTSDSSSLSSAVRRSDSGRRDSATIPNPAPGPSGDSKCHIGALNENWPDGYGTHVPGSNQTFQPPNRLLVSSGAPHTILGPPCSLGGGGE